MAAVRVPLVPLFAEGDDPPLAPTVPHAAQGFTGMVEFWGINA